MEEGEGGGNFGGGGNSVLFRTSSICTTAVTVFSRDYNTQERAYTEYIPYPSSVKIVKTLHEGETAKNIGAYLGRFLDLPLGLPSTPAKAVEYYRFFELNVQGHLCVPITGPRIVGGAWDGSAEFDSFTRAQLKCAYALPGSTGDYVGTAFKLDTLAEGEREGGKPPEFIKTPDTNVITLDNSVNITAGSELWVCNRDFSLLGITNGVAPFVAAPVVIN
ncbi:hypothetical protein TWF506_000115 [Arthrobotrys conoides]|uniref:Uncharacterized protein n=1 Tax=Arthrobotrys conoides TaxID=74498 RepID=A0AAN8NZ05_9PEZI